MTMRAVRELPLQTTFGWLSLRRTVNGRRLAVNGEMFIKNNNWHKWGGIVTANTYIFWKKD
jgi:hypothetical protein